VNISSVSESKCAFANQTKGQCLAVAQKQQKRSAMQEDTQL
jgi:hypothetical protein